MTYRTTLTLDNEAYDFLMVAGGENKSAYINRLLKEEKRRTLEQEVLQANQAEAEDMEYQAQLAGWDITLNDGLPDHV